MRDAFGIPRSQLYFSVYGFVTFTSKKHPWSLAFLGKIQSTNITPEHGK